jgi:hypothetical protein
MLAHGEVALVNVTQSSLFAGRKSDESSGRK